MTCPKCKGDGWNVVKVAFRDKSGRKDWNYENRKCLTCMGKGYLTPEECGQGKM